jgi:signal transduction histidine kinase
MSSLWDTRQQAAEKPARSARSYFRPIRAPLEVATLEVVRSELIALWNEPRPERPPGSPWWDRALALGFALAAVAESLLREDGVPRTVRIALGLAFAAALYFRRAHPLGAVAAAFGLAIAATVGEALLGLSRVGPYTGACVLLLPYSLVRWASWREVAAGLAIMAGAYGASAVHGEMNGPGDAIGGLVVMLFPGALGASVRFRAEAHRREVEHARSRERERLARELHDVVAHHVTAIAIQAQAGRAVVATRPDAAAGALDAIAREAAETLGELRAMVGALRDEGAAPLAPQGRIADIEALARRAGDALPVEVELAGDLGGLRPAVETALYRLAQESITNATRHARSATCIRVRLSAESDGVRLTVQDDGAPSGRRSSGFGLVGMAERAALLGGTLEAGPSAGGGWRVEAVLPREGGVR